MVDFVTGLRCRECAAPTRPKRCTSATAASGRSRWSTTTSGSPPPSPGSGSRPAPARSGATATCCRPTTTAPVDLGAGFTPLVRADRLAAELGLGELWIKNDTANPTGSFKDRVVSVALTKARELGFKVAACASTGNLANSVAAHAARAGMDSVVFIPADLEAAKVTMTAVFGGTLVAVDGNYDDVNRLCAELASEHPSWAFVNVNVRTYYAEGSKTLAFEVAEQLGWQAPGPCRGPHRLGQPADQGGQGLRRAGTVGLLDEEPAVRVSGAQAEGCSPVATAFAEGTDVIRPVKPQTIAKSLAIGNPADGRYALEAVRALGRLVRLGDRRRDRRRHPAAGPHRGHLRRDGRRGDHRHPGQAGRRGRGPPRRAGRGLRHRPRAEDRRGRGRHRRARPTATIAPTLDAFDAAASSPTNRRPRSPPMSVTVRIPTQLRTLTGGTARSRSRGRRSARSEALDAAHPGSPSALRRRRATCAASSTSSWPTRTSASSTAWTRRSPGPDLSIVPAVAGG